MRPLFVVVAWFSVAGCSGATHSSQTMLTRPKFLAVESESTWTSRACVDTSAVAHERLDALVDDLFTQAGLRGPLVTTGDRSCRWMLRLTADDPALSEPAQLVWAADASDPDRFAATTVHRDGETMLTTIFATSERGAMFGLRGALKLFVDRYGSDGQSVFAGTLVDYPGFPRRGIIEGFYGPTYSPVERAKLIGLASYLRENTYIYALKDADPFTHTRWRDAYDETWAPIVAGAVVAAQRNLVDFVWAASPGWYGGPEFQSHSIHYGSDDDFAQLVAKTENLRALGVERFALFVDDVSPDFAWPDDAARFSSLAAAHAFLINRWDDYLMATGAPEHLWVVGSKYTSDESNFLSGSGWQDYNRTLAAAIHPEIRMLWTGPQVYSERIANSDLEPIEDIVQRPLYIWDNWPKTPEALTGRDPNLNLRAGGLLSNFVMDGDRAPSDALYDFEQSLGTIADYAWQPESYNPWWSLARWTPQLDELLPRMPER